MGVTFSTSGPGTTNDTEYKMKAIAINKHGSFDVLESLEVSKPASGENDLLVNVHFSSVNPLDCRIRRDTESPRDFPLILGFDVCGTVVETGANVKDFSRGDLIAASPNVFKPGANAEYVQVDSRTAAKVPDNVEPKYAAVLPLVGITAMESLYDRAKIQKGQVLLIHAGAGGVGHLAIQLAKNSGCEVITTASRKESIELCYELGADTVINYKKSNFVDEVFRITGNEGCDAVFDFVGEDVLNKSLECAKVNGQVVTITPSRVLKQGTTFLVKNLTIHYEFMGTATVFGIDIESQGGKLQRLIDMVSNDKLKPYIGNKFSISQLSSAHKIQESGEALGKILISNEEWL